MGLFKLAKENLLVFSGISFVFIATFAISLSDNPSIVYFGKNQSSNVSPLPVLSDTNSFPILSAQGVIAKDVRSGVILYDKNSEKKLLPASTTKIMTALVVLDTYDFEEIITIGAIKSEGQRMRLVEGEQITVRDLMYGLLVYSANDAAEVLAENYPGGRSAFVMAMNTKAKDLYLENTHFANPSGLEDVGHVSSARDLVRLSEIAMQNPKFAQIVGTEKEVVKSIDGKYTHYLTNINQLLGKVDGVLGVKTGWTENARENLVTYVVRDDKEVLIALLGSQDRFGETEELIEWIYDNYDWKNVEYSSYLVP